MSPPQPPSAPVIASNSAPCQCAGAKQDPLEFWVGLGAGTIVGSVVEYGIAAAGGMPFAVSAIALTAAGYYGTKAGEKLGGYINQLEQAIGESEFGHQWGSFEGWARSGTE